MERKDEYGFSAARNRYVRALNGTGIFLHTGLGRAPLPARLFGDLASFLEGYTILEVDPATGERDRREEGVAKIVKKITSAEACTVVNNNAAAVLLAVAAIARGGEVVVSRGELVEIGGGFRIPEVLACSGARLREVGTANRTRIEDYEEAVGPETRLVMKVHASNYTVVGEQSSPGREEIVALARRAGVPVLEDLGSGLLQRYGLDLFEGEPTVGEALEGGVDLVTFSGDKLIGGPQAGLILGRRKFVEAMRAAPLFRAVRPDKTALSLLELVLGGYAASSSRPPPLPFFLALEEARSGRLAVRAGELAKVLGKEVHGARFRVVETEAFAGSGSLPLRPIPSAAVAVRAQDLSPRDLAGRLRKSAPPLFTTVKGDEVRVDLFTLLPGEEEGVVISLRKVLEEG